MYNIAMSHQLPASVVSAHFKHILAIKLADLGDLLAVTPALQALRAAQPHARIDLLVPPGSAKLLRGASFIDKIITFDKFAFDTLGGLLDLPSLIRTTRFLISLRRAGYDAVIIFHHFTLRFGIIKFHTLSFATGAGTVAGLDNGQVRFLTRHAPDRGFGAMHEVEYWLQVAALLGADASGAWRPCIPLDDADRERVAQLILASGMTHARPLVAIHPGAGAYSLARIWPTEGFAQVAKGLIKSHNATITILGGPDEIALASELEKLIGCGKHVYNLAGRTGIHETAAFMERCDLFLGNDSGPMHIAAAMQTPVVAVFGPSNQQAWGPYTPPGEANVHTIVARDLPCMPCFYRGHTLGLREGCGPRPCLTALSAQPVLQACRQTLDREVGDQRIVRSYACDGN